MKKFFVPLIVLLLLASVFFNTLLIVRGFDNNQWDPLADYAVQEVASGQRDDKGIPVVSDGLVSTIGIKCSKESEGEVAVAGIVFWQTIEPKGTQVLAGEGTSTRYPSSTPEENWKFQFENKVPQSVKDYATDHYKRTGTVPLWQLTGRETPVRDGEEGVIGIWKTEPFYIAP